MNYGLKKKTKAATPTNRSKTPERIGIVKAEEIYRKDKTPERKVRNNVGSRSGYSEKFRTSLSKSPKRSYIDTCTQESEIEKIQGRTYDQSNSTNNDRITSIRTNYQQLQDPRLYNNPLENIANEGYEPYKNTFKQIHHTTNPTYQIPKSPESHMDHNYFYHQNGSLSPKISSEYQDLNVDKLGSEITDQLQLKLLEKNMNEKNYLSRLIQQRDIQQKNLKIHIQKLEDIIKQRTDSEHVLLIEREKLGLDLKRLEEVVRRMRDETVAKSDYINLKRQLTNKEQAEEDLLWKLEQNNSKMNNVKRLKSNLQKLDKDKKEIEGLYEESRDLLKQEKEKFNFGTRKISKELEFSKNVVEQFSRKCVQITNVLVENRKNPDIGILIEDEEPNLLNDLMDEDLILDGEDINDVTNNMNKIIIQKLKDEFVSFLDTYNKNIQTIQQTKNEQNKLMENSQREINLKKRQTVELESGLDEQATDWKVKDHEIKVQNIEIDQLKEDLDISLENNKTLETQHKVLLDGLNQQLTHKDSQIQNLTEEFEKTDGKANEIQTDLAILKAEKELLTEEVDQLSDLKIQQNDLIEKYMKQFQCKDDEMLERENNFEKERLEWQKQEFSMKDSLRAEIDLLGKEKSDHANSEKLLIIKNDELKVELRALKLAELDHKQGDKQLIDEQGDKIAEYSSFIRKLENYKKDNEEKIVSLNSKVKELERNLSIEKDQGLIYSGKVGAQTKEESRLRELLNSEKEKSKGLYAEVERQIEFTGNVTELKKRLDDEKAVSKMLQGLEAQNKKMIESKNCEIKGIQDEYDKAKKRASEQEINAVTAIENLNVKVENSERSRQNLLAKIEELTHDNNESSKNYEKFMKGIAIELEEQISKVNKLEAIKQNLEIELQTQEKSQSSSQDAFKNFQDEQAKNSELTKQIMSLNEQMAHYRNRVIGRAEAAENDEELVQELIKRNEEIKMIELKNQEFVAKNTENSKKIREMESMMSQYTIKIEQLTTAKDRAKNRASITNSHIINKRKSRSTIDNEEDEILDIKTELDKLPYTHSDITQSPNRNRRSSTKLGHNHTSKIVKDYQIVESFEQITSTSKLTMNEQIPRLNRLNMSEVSQSRRRSSKFERLSGAWGGGSGKRINNQQSQATGLMTLEPLNAELYYGDSIVMEFEPYVVIQIGKKADQTSSAIGFGAEPQWTEQLALKIEGEDSAKVLQLDSDKNRMADMIGEGDLAQANCITHVKGFQVISLMNQGKLCGKITMRYIFMEDDAHEISGGRGISNNHGIGLALRDGYDDKKSSQDKQNSGRRGSKSHIHR